MQTIKGNIWDYHTQGKIIVVTTNGDINSSGKCVMGRGIALQTKEKFPDFPKVLANHIKRFGNTLGYFQKYNIISYPTKHHWYLKSDLQLIEESAQNLKKFVDIQNHISPKGVESKFSKIYMVKPGVGNGKRKWEEVEPLISPYLDDRFIIVDY